MQIRNKILDNMIVKIARMTIDEAMDHDLEIFLAIKRYRLMGLGEDGVAALAVRHGFERYLEFFLEFNPSNDAPYHNLYHTYCMVLNCMEGAYHEKLTESEVRIVLVAALFHDFDHTMGKEPDQINIQRALKGLESGHRMAKAQGHALTDDEIDVVRTCIGITKYPYEAEPLTPLEKIIRDADLMQPYETDKAVLVKQYLGLKAEVQVAKKVTFTNEEFSQGMRAWLDKEVVWHTDWAKEKADEKDFDEATDRLVSLLAGE